MLQELNCASRQVGLSMNLQKTKIMSINNIKLTIDKVTIQNVEGYVLGPLLN